MNLMSQSGGGVCIISKRTKGEDQVFTVQLMTGFGEFSLEEWKANLHYFGAGINDIAGVPGLQSGP